MLFDSLSLIMCWPNSVSAKPWMLDVSVLIQSEQRHLCPFFSLFKVLSVGLGRQIVAHTKSHANCVTTRSTSTTSANFIIAPGLNGLFANRLFVSVPAWIILMELCERTNKRRGARKNDPFVCRCCWYLRLRSLRARVCLIYTRPN